ncbi:hypothetical protein NBRC10512_002254 [Rhodotorula toruloides]|uniref:F-box domain-containing protein n=1 Tax=Rhodotorula toruloides (strain NP11) TaxID=1130832 RepID=M7WVS3_RHOT1|nr:uncharacterized protein RHTO_00940 [Rhodotorula toruloides NP11]EMS22186.1 hypothetical protein RHTO_00940 [Rhodotorula toruloides NP11]
MPTFLPLDLVLAIVRLATAREVPDEDSPMHHQRVAHLCLVCKAFWDVVEPLLWKALQIGRIEELHSFAERSGRHPRLLEQVEEFRGGDGGAGALSGRRPALGSHAVSMEAFAMFEHLTILELSCHRLADLPTDLQLPLLEALSLRECFVAMATCQRLLMPTCTPKLRKMHLDCVIMHSTGFLIATPDPRPLDYLQLVAWDRQFYPPIYLGLHRVQNIVHGWSVAKRIRNFPSAASLGTPLHLRLYPLPKRSEKHSIHLNYDDEIEDAIASVCNMTSRGRVKSLFLPSDFDNPAWFDHRRTRALFFSLFEACRDSDTPVIIYDEGESEDDFLPAFDRFLASSGNTDVRERLLQENIERVRIWQEYTTEHQLEYPPNRSSSGGDSRLNDS